MMRTLTLLIGILAIFTACEPNPKEMPLPAPVEILGEGEAEGEEKESQRERYFENIHRAAPGTDWRKLEAHNAMARHRKRQARPDAVKSIETFADGLLSGEWFERGSKFTAGSIFDVVQDPDDANRLFIISAGGSIWEMDYAAEEFSLVNHDIYFDGSFLGLVPTIEGRNMIAFSESRPMYSTDDGSRWEFSDVSKGGELVNADDVTNWFSPQVIGGNVFTTLQINWGAYETFRSEDGGQSYTIFAMPPVENEAGEESITHVYHPPGIDRLFVLVKTMYDDPKVRIFEVVDMDADDPYRFVGEVAIETTGFFRGRIAVAAQPGTSDMRMYIQADDQLFRSNDDGEAFIEMPRLETNPWSQQAIYVRPSDPDFVAFGAVELWVSRDGGETFLTPNKWYDYYNDISMYLHADIMRLTEITDPDGELQMLVSSHGGLNRLNPEDSLWYNIAQEGLNVAQYYDVSTNPGDPRVIYAGSQDQGFQVLTDDDPNGREVLGGYQFFSGDYGHTVFGENGNIYATAYPFGTIYAFYDVLADDGQFQSWTAYEVEYGDEFIWIAPMMSPPRIDGQMIYYVAGGSADSTSEGSHLIEVTMNRDENSPSYGEMTGENKPFDFIDAAAGNISAMTYSPVNTERFYVATEAGRFFASEDEGDSWEETLNFLPDGWYLYGQAIHASKTEEETVWLGGSGYSNPPVWRSTNGGEDFDPVSDGLPPTVVNGLASSPTESMIFAATEAGAFVYIASEERWFDLSGQFAPTMRYVSVEFLEDRNIARFGTYGRGAWDFQVEELVPTEDLFAANETVNVYPNPASGMTTVEGNAAGYRLYDVTGREVRRVVATGERTRVPLAGLDAGIYFVQPLDAEGRGTGLAERLVVR
jgi:hypothetical protein